MLASFFPWSFIVSCVWIFLVLAQGFDTTVNQTRRDTLVPSTGTYTYSTLHGGRRYLEHGMHLGGTTKYARRERSRISRSSTALSGRFVLSTVGRGRIHQDGWATGSAQCYFWCHWDTLTRRCQVDWNGTHRFWQRDSHVWFPPKNNAHRRFVVAEWMYILYIYIGQRVYQDTWDYQRQTVWNSLSRRGSCCPRFAHENAQIQSKATLHCRRSLGARVSKGRTGKRNGASRRRTIGRARLFRIQSRGPEHGEATNVWGGSFLPRSNDWCTNLVS